MPPRKVDKKPINKGEPKILRNRKKKNNVEINIPEIRVTIPQNQQNILNGFGSQFENENSIPGKNDIKIMLANEVVRRQFPKKKTLLEKPNGSTSKIKENKIIKKSSSLGNRQRLLKTNKMSEVSEKNLQGKCGRKAVAKNNSILINTEQQLEQTKEIMPHEKTKETKKLVKLRRNRIQNSEPGEIKTQLTNAVIKRKPGPRSGPRTRKKINDKAKKTESKETKTSGSKNKITDTEDLLNPKRLHLTDSLAGSELSWTKDISSSSTSTCLTVSSNDFFRIDNKIPFIKLTNIDEQLRNDREENANDNYKEKQNNMDTELQYVKTSDNHLSSSSSSSSSSDQETCHNVQITPAISTLDKLALKLKNFDLEMINWIGGNCREKNTSNDLSNTQNKIIDNIFLQEERDVILHCQSIKQILSEYSLIEENEEENCNNHIEVNVESNMNISDNTKETTIEKSQQSISTIEIKPSELDDKTHHNNTFNDEDDALSLYAESITDMESPRNWNQKSREIVEEYVPLPTKDDIFKRPEKVIYKPTKIKKVMVKEAENAMEIGICEKSNADSTSMYKDNNESASDENIVVYEDRLGEIEKPSGNPVQNESILMGINQKPKLAIHSVLFKGICIYNLMSNCKKKFCKFPHIILVKDVVRFRLRKLDDLLFQEEYIFVRAWTSLRRLYGICFVEDCIRRRLTRVVIGMTLDLVRKSSYNKEDGILVINAVETTLLYLNDIELHAYGDLLKQNVKNNTLLCNVFLDTIAKSQNFSRFKIVFTNLTDFMCDIGCSFKMNMASHVLERVCILPYDFNLARTLIKVIRNTDVNIFSNPIMKMFEHHLHISSTELYKEFCALKDGNSKSLSGGNCYNAMDNDSERLNNPSYSENDIRYSPDTTNMDNFIKTPIEQKFKRTIDLRKLKVFNDLPISSSAECEEIYTHRHHKTWKNNRNSNYRPLLNRNLVRGRNPNMRPPLRPAFNRRSDQTFGPSPNKFPRIFGPTYF